MAVMSLTAAAAAEMKVASQKGEKWWGVFVGNSPQQPFLQPFNITPGERNASGFTAPMLISDLGRFVYCSSPMGVRFDAGNFTITYEGTPPELINAGRSMRDAYRVACLKYFPPNNIAPAVDFFKQPLYQTIFDLGAFPTQEAVAAYADRLDKEGFPKGILLIGEGWSQTPGTYSFDPHTFPDPKALTDRLHAKGFRLMLTVSPYASASGREYVENLRKGYLIMDNDNKPVIVRDEGGYYAAFNLGDKRIYDDIHSSLVRLKSDYGIDGLCFDSNSLLPALTSVQGNRLMSRWLDMGKDAGLSQYYPGQTTQYTPYDNVVGAPAEKPHGSPIIYDLTNLISAQLCGYQFCRFTPCALSDTTALFSQNWLMQRTIQFQSMLPLQTVPFAPWRIKDRAMYQSIKQTLKYREGMAEYFAQLYKESLINGEPMVRHMEYQFPRSGFSDCNDQFMLGGKYLCAPFYNREISRMVRLPRGVWTDSRGRKFRGPLVTTINDVDGRPAIFELATK